MPIHRVPATRGLGWLSESLDITGKHPGTVLGAVGLALVAAIGLALVVSLVTLGGTSTDAATSLVRALPLLLLVTLLQPVLLGGLLALLDRIERGEAAAAATVFAGFGGGRLLPLASLGLVQLAAVALNLLALHGLGGEDFLARYWAYFAELQPGQGFDPAAVPQPKHGGLVTLINIATNFLATAILVFSTPQVMLAGRDPLTAVLEALRAVLLNLPALLLAALVVFFGLIVAVLVLGLVSTLLGLIGGLIAPAVGGLLVFVLILLVVLAVFAMLAGAAYLAWREVFGMQAGSAEGEVEL